MVAKRIITVVGCHAEGEQGDVITGGVLPPPGDTMMSKKLAFERDHDDIRRLLLCEPRGSVARHVNLIVPSTRDDCAAGAIIMEPTEYPPMSGSNTMCIATVLLETGVIPMIEPETRFRLDMPAGPVDIVAECRDGKCVSVTLKNVPAFAFALDAVLELVGHGSITIDISYGGMIYAIVDAAALGFEIVPDEARDLAVLGEQIRTAAREQHPVTHPELPDIKDVSIVQFAGPLVHEWQPGQRPQHVHRVTRSFRPFADRHRHDRADGRAARQRVVGGRRRADPFVDHRVGVPRHDRRRDHRSVPFPAIEATIRGRAWITGLHHYFVDADDPWPSGYVLSDTWGTSTSVAQR